MLHGEIYVRFNEIIMVFCFLQNNADRNLIELEGFIPGATWDLMTETD